jgi:hypothetical protein
MVRIGALDHDNHIDIGIEDCWQWSSQWKIDSVAAMETADSICRPTGTDANGWALFVATMRASLCCAGQALRNKTRYVASALPQPVFTARERWKSCLEASVLRIPGVYYAASQGNLNKV